MTNCHCECEWNGAAAPINIFHILGTIIEINRQVSGVYINHKIVILYSLLYRYVYE